MLADAEQSADRTAREAESLCALANSWGDEDATAPHRPTEREAGLHVALARIAAAEAALDHALERTYPTVWAYAEAKYLAASEAAGICDEEAGEAINDDIDKVSAAASDIYDLWNRSIDDLAETPAPDWRSLSVKAEALVAKYSDRPTGRWTVAANSFVAVARSIGSVPLAEADLIEVMNARGQAETMAYALAHDPDGYSGYACWGGAIGPMSALAECVLVESRKFAASSPGQHAMSAAVISAVWFGQIPGEPPHIDPVDEATDRFSTALREHLRCERIPPSQTSPDQKAASDAAFAQMIEAEAEAQAAAPTTRGGVAFQLLAAAGDLDCVRAGNTEQIKEDAEERIRTTICSAIRVLGLPFDYEAANFYVGDRLAGLSGADRPGPRRTAIRASARAAQ